MHVFLSKVAGDSNRTAAFLPCTGVLLCVLGNKNDLPNARNEETLGTFFNLAGQREQGRNSFVHSVSAKTGDGIKEAMEHLAKAVKEAAAAKKS